jgi:hypothetical protein
MELVGSIMEKKEIFNKTESFPGPSVQATGVSLVYFTQIKSAFQSNSSNRIIGLSSGRPAVTVQLWT